MLDDLFTFLGSDKVKNIATVVATVLFSVLGLLFNRRARKADERRKRHEADEAEARAGLSLNMKAKTNIYESDEYLFIETVVEVVNPSRKAWVIPAAYICYRAMIDTKTPVPFTGKETFQDLPKCDGLAEMRNRAFLPKSLNAIGPDEIVIFTRIDRLPKSFKDRYPVLWINVELFGASYELLGPQKLKENRMGEVRVEWIKFMSEVESQPESYMVFSRLDPLKESPQKGFDPGDRCLVSRHAGRDMFDEKRSRQFHNVLQSAFQWTLDQTVKIDCS